MLVAAALPRTGPTLHKEPLVKVIASSLRKGNVLEIDGKLSALLEKRYAGDDRLQVVTDSAENVAAYLDGQRADVLVSAIPFTSLDGTLRTRILDALPGLLAPKGVLVLIQYSPLLMGELRRRFRSVRWRITPWNVPPAFLFACSQDEPA